MTVVAEGMEDSVGTVEDVIADVADNFSALVRTFERARAQFLAAAQHDVEWSASLLINHVVMFGPIRASALAEKVQSDPSTVSRQVAALVADGMIERRADPDDGRASLLVPTARGYAAYEAHREARNQHFGQMMADWPTDDCRTFARLLGRFAADYDSAKSTLIASVSKGSAAKGNSAKSSEEIA